MPRACTSAWVGSAWGRSPTMRCFRRAGSAAPPCTTDASASERRSAVREHVLLGAFAAYRFFFCLGLWISQDEVAHGTPKLRELFTRERRVTGDPIARPA